MNDRDFNFQRLKISLKGGVTASPFGRKIVQTLVTSYITQSYKTVLWGKILYGLSHSTK